MSNGKNPLSTNTEKLSNDTISEYIDHVERSIQYYLTLTQEERKLIKNYKGLHYKKYNSILMGDGLITSTKFLNSPNIKSIPEDIVKLNKIIINAPKTQKDIYVYRGQDQSMKTVHYDKKRSEFLYENYNFMSTSVFKKIAVSFSGYDCCLYRIKIPKGTPILVVFNDPYADTYEKISDLISELEVEMILPPYCKFIMHKEIKYTPKKTDIVEYIQIKDLKNKKDVFEKNYSKFGKTLKTSVETKDLELVEYQKPEDAPIAENIRKYMKVTMFYNDANKDKKSSCVIL